MNVNWNLYRLFYYVAKTGSTSAASKELFIAQPSVSHGIKQLEESLGCELFVRSFHGMELTEAGCTLYEYLGDAVNAIESAESHLKSLQTRDSNIIRVAITDTTLQFFLIPMMEYFNEKFPELMVHIQQCTTVEKAEEMLDNHSVDLAVMCDPSVRKDMSSVPVKKVSDVLVYDARYADHFTDHANAAQVAKFPVIMHCRPSPSRYLQDAYFEEQGIEIHPQYEFVHVSSIIRQIRSEPSCAFVLSELIKTELATGDLKIIDLDPPLPSRYYYMISANGIQSRAVQTFIRYVKKNVNL